MPATSHQPRLEFQTRSPDETSALGRGLGNRLDRGLTLLLFGDLASGKTAFCKGLARGLGVSSSYAIVSPTYTLINEYPRTASLLSCGPVPLARTVGSR